MDIKGLPSGSNVKAANPASSRSEGMAPELQAAGKERITPAMQQAGAAAAPPKKVSDVIVLEPLHVPDHSVELESDKVKWQSFAHGDPMKEFIDKLVVPSNRV